MFDYHMHSSFSADCDAAMEEMVRGSIEKGLSEICFTEHIDYDYPDDSIVFDFDQQEYAAAICKFQQQHQDRISIKKGVEIGIQPHLFDRYNDLLTKTDFDFIILSMHTVEQKSLHYKELFTDRTAEEAFAAYYNELLYCVKHFSRYSVLGHVDLIKRYTDEPVLRDFHDCLSVLFDTIIPAGKGIELNTSGYRYGLLEGLPSLDVLKLYKECGGEIITLGSDAHRPNEIAFRFKESLQQLQAAGFRYVCTFCDEKPAFHLIDSL